MVKRFFVLLETFLVWRWRVGFFGGGTWGVGGGGLVSQEWGGCLGWQEGGAGKDGKGGVVVVNTRCQSNNGKVRSPPQLVFCSAFSLVPLVYPPMTIYSLTHSPVYISIITPCTLSVYIHRYHHLPLPYQSRYMLNPRHYCCPRMNLFLNFQACWNYLSGEKSHLEDVFAKIFGFEEGLLRRQLEWKQGLWYKVCCLLRARSEGCMLDLFGLRNESEETCSDTLPGPMCMGTI